MTPTPKIVQLFWFYYGSRRTSKLPSFWMSQPRVWFAQAEAQFTLRGITADETKYYYVVAALDQGTATRLLNLLSHPPTEDKYPTLKTRLLETFDLSEQERAAKLLHLRPLGDSKPSTLMDEMLALCSLRDSQWIQDRRLQTSGKKS